MQITLEALDQLFMILTTVWLGEDLLSKFYKFLIHWKWYLLYCKTMTEGRFLRVTAVLTSPIGKRLTQKWASRSTDLYKNVRWKLLKILSNFLRWEIHMKGWASANSTFMFDLTNEKSAPGLKKKLPSDVCTI
jgi:hypothetical protein